MKTRGFPSQPFDWFGFIRNILYVNYRYLFMLHILYDNLFYEVKINRINKKIFLFIIKNQLVTNQLESTKKAFKAF